MTSWLYVPSVIVIDAFFLMVSVKSLVTVFVWSCPTVVSMSYCAWIVIFSLPAVSSIVIAL